MSSRYGEKIWVSRSIISIQARKGKINTFIFYNNDHSGRRGNLRIQHASRRVESV